MTDESPGAAQQLFITKRPDFQAESLLNSMCYRLFALPVVRVSLDLDSRNGNHVAKWLAL
jgi:hypothetical protein